MRGENRIPQRRVKKLGVYIKSFNIPECCYQCFNTEFACAIGCHKWTDMEYKDRYEGRAKDCPLVEVKTPHGDLVDHEALGEILLWRMMNMDVHNDLEPKAICMTIDALKGKEYD